MSSHISKTPDELDGTEDYILKSLPQSLVFIFMYPPFIVIGLRKLNQIKDSSMNKSYCVISLWIVMMLIAILFLQMIICLVVIGLYQIKSKNKTNEYVYGTIRKGAIYAHGPLSVLNGLMINYVTVTQALEWMAMNFIINQ